MKKIKIKELQYKYNKNIVYLAMLPLIFFGKIIRYTIMKQVLVDTSIGHSMLVQINNNNTPFSFLTEEGTSAATGNATWLFHFFKIFGFATYTEYEILITIIWNILLLILLRKSYRKLTSGQTFWLMLSIVVLNIFDFNLAKEPVQMLYFIALFYIITTKYFSIKQKYILSIFMILFSTLTYRAYYILILFFAVELWILFKFFSRKGKSVRLKQVLIMLVILTFTYYILLRVCQIVSPTTFAELFRVRTRTSTAASDMRVIFQSNNLIIFCMDYLIMLIRMLFPIELLRLGIKYFPYVLYQLTISLNIINAMINKKKNDEEQNLALYIYLGFLLASGTFEPDFGSWVRHEAVCFPIFLIINNMVRVKRREKKYE